MRITQRVVTKNGFIPSGGERKKVSYKMPLNSIAIKDNNMVTIEFSTVNLFKFFSDGDKQLQTVINIPLSELEKLMLHQKQLTLFQDE